jgi:hypothetical protein
MRFNEIKVPLIEASAKAEKLKHGSTRGHLGEFLLGAAIVAKFVKGDGPINKQDAIDVITKTAQTDNLTALFKGDASDEIGFQNIVVNQKNIADAKEPETVRIMSTELDAAVKYANSETAVVKWSRIFAKNGKPDRILVKAAGEEDQKGTKADIFLTYIRPDGSPRVLKALSVKTGSNLVGQASPRTFDNMQMFFKELGITLQPIDNYENNINKHVNSILAQAADDLNRMTAGDNTAKESALVKNVANFLNEHVGKKDSSLQVVNIGQGDYSAQTVKKMIKNLATVDLAATLKKGGQPAVLVHSIGNPKNLLFQIRYTYSAPRTGSDGNTRPERHRMFVETGALWKTLGTINRKDVEQDTDELTPVSEPVDDIKQSA